MAYQSQFQVHFDDADPAGIAFFGNLFTKIHHCYEEFLQAMGVDLKQWFLSPEVIAPIRHSEAEYFKPLFPFETYNVDIKVLSLSESTFRLEFNIHQKGEKNSIVRTTHVCCSAKTFQKVSIPEKLKVELEKFL